VLMTSRERRSEEQLAVLACEALAGKKAPRVLIGGLGMGYTLRAALDRLPEAARIEVAELTPEVENWCRGPLAVLTANAAGDRRVSIMIDDVANVLGHARNAYDAILLDLYEGPHAASQRADDPFYGKAALAKAHAALVPGGVFAVWSEEPDDAFLRRLRATGFDVESDRSGSSRIHIVYVGRRRA